MKDITMFKATLKTTKMVMRLFIRTLKTLLVVLVEIWKLMAQAMMDVTEWFYHTVVKVLKTAYNG